MFEVSFGYSDNLNDLDEEVKRAIIVKLTELTDILYNKVVGNLSGKILQKQSGQLLSSVQQEVTSTSGGDTWIGRVFIEPETPKALALEYGGKGYYTIVPTKANLLRFLGKDGSMVFAKSVHHPPAQAYAYLRNALAEMEPLVPEIFREGIQAALDGKRS